MGATDVQPSRAAAAASGLDDMFQHLRGDRVGLVTFGGSAFQRSPLTLDLDALSFLVNRAQLEGSLVEPGTDIGKAIEASLRLLDVPDRAPDQAIVLISDGENLGADIDAAAQDAKQQGVRIYTVAVGTDAGATVPPRATPEPGRIQPAPSEGDSTVSRADRATLGRIASLTGGDTREVGGIAGLAVEFARLQQTSFDEESETIPVERFQWFLGAAIALLLLQWLIAEGRRTGVPLRVRRRRGLGAGALLGLLALATFFGGCGGTAAYQKVHDGNEAYQAGRYEDALTAYQAAKDLLPADPIVDYNIGNTLDRLGRFDEALTASRSAAQEADRNGDGETYVFATYAAGNHAFATNALEQARDAYIDTLLRDPGDADAKHNLEIVLRLIDPNQGQSQQPTPTPGAGNGPPQPGGSPQPGEGTTQPGATPGAGGAAATATPGAGQPGATPEATGTAAPGATPSSTGQPGGEGTGDAESLQQQLDELLADGVSLEDALAILDRLRQESEAAGLQPRGPQGGDATDR
jgi:Ca-activated chloride channel family protein